MRPALLAILLASVLAACSGGNRDAPFQIGKSTTDAALATPPAQFFERAR